MQHAVRFSSSRGAFAPSLPRSVQACRARAALRQRGPVIVRAGNPLVDFFNKGKVQAAVAAAGQYDEAGTKAKIERLIAETPVLVFSWSGCPFCKRAKAVLDAAGAQYTALELDTMGAEGKALRAELAKMTGRSSVPNIWIAGQNVGGCSEGPGVVPLQDKGELIPMLKAAGAL